MLAIISWWEAALALGVLLLALGEVISLEAARRRGLTDNVSRLATHGALAVLSAVYAWVEVRWSSDLDAAVAGGVVDRFGVSNWGLLALAGMVGLALYEMVAHIWSMHLGRTRSVARLVTHIAMPVIVVLLVMMNLTRWQIYRRSILAESPEGAPTDGLLQVIGIWELVLVISVVLLAVREFYTLWLARRAGKTQNVWRLWVYALLAVVSGAYSLIAVSWARGLRNAGSIAVDAHPVIADWGLFALAAMLFLALYALVMISLARRFGLTASVTRMVTHVVMAAFVVLIVAINLTRWQMYFGLLDESYEGSIRSDVGGSP